MRNRTLTSALDGRTPYDVVYGVKPDLADLCAFSVPCAIVERGAKLKKLELCACSWGISTEGVAIGFGIRISQWWLN